MAKGNLIGPRSKLNKVPRSKETYLTLNQLAIPSLLVSATFQWLKAHLLLRVPYMTVSMMSRAATLESLGRNSLNIQFRRSDTSKLHCLKSLTKMQRRMRKPKSSASYAETLTMSPNLWRRSPIIWLFKLLSESYAVICFNDKRKREGCMVLLRYFCGFKQ